MTITPQQTKRGVGRVQQNFANTGGIVREVLMTFLLYIIHATFPDSPNRDCLREQKSVTAQKFIIVKLWDWLAHSERIR